MSRGEAFEIKAESLNLMNLRRDTIGSSLAFSQELYLDPFPFQIRCLAN
jgi:hypothetical protein